MHQDLGFFLNISCTGHLHTCHPSTQEVKERELVVSDHPTLNSEFEDSLGFIGQQRK